MFSAPELELREGIEAFLEQNLTKELLRFTTAGSVDDGKSTLIGRLLHDSKAVYEDQLASVKKSRINRAAGPIDFSLLTDGLRAEREQGITIDVAYRYFSTSRRKFIIADTPGHEQYTRNMATGASTADLAVILVDGTKGLLPQTRRHAYIASLLGIRNVIAAINKMDLVDYREDVFLRLQQEFAALAERLGIPFVQCIPISALEGDNVVARSERTPWYEGPALLEHLETVPISAAAMTGALRFPIQSVIRPDSSFRGFAGRVASGTVHPGDTVLALPSGQQTKVQSIVTYDGEADAAGSSASVVVKLQDEIDLSRGEMLVSPASPPYVSRRFAAMVVWLHATPLDLDRTYLAKHAGRLVKAHATKIRFRVDVNNLDEHSANRLEMNEIALVEFQTSSAIFFDSYEDNRITGSCILIDPLSNATVGAAMIREDLSNQATTGDENSELRNSSQTGITPEERQRRNGHRPAIFGVAGDQGFAELLERSLFERGYQAILISNETAPLSDSSPSWGAAVPSAPLGTGLRPYGPPALLSTLWGMGAVIVYLHDSRSLEDQAVLKAIAGEFVFDVSADASGNNEADILHATLALAEGLRLRDTALETQEN